MPDTTPGAEGSAPEADRSTVDDEMTAAAEAPTEGGATVTERHTPGSAAARTAAQDTPPGATGAGRES